MQVKDNQPSLLRRLEDIAATTAPIAIDDSRNLAQNRQDDRSIAVYFPNIAEALWIAAIDPSISLLQRFVKSVEQPCFAMKNIKGMVRLLVDAEMKMFAGLKTPVIFLQNVVTNLILGIEIKDTFRIFAHHVRQKYGAKPGFITMNMPRSIRESLEIQPLSGLV